MGGWTEDHHKVGLLFYILQFVTEVNLWKCRQLLSAQNINADVRIWMWAEIEPRSLVCLSLVAPSAAVMGLWYESIRQVKAHFTTLVLLPCAALILFAIADKGQQLHFTGVPSAQVLFSFSFVLTKLLRETVIKILLSLLPWLPASGAGLWHGSQTDAWGVDCRNSEALLEVMEEEDLAHLHADEELPHAEFAEVQYQENHEMQSWLDREEESLRAK